MLKLLNLGRFLIDCMIGYNRKALSRITRRKSKRHRFVMEDFIRR